VELGEDAFAFYDVCEGAFKIEAGEFNIMAGPSSAELPLNAKVTL
jgi:beta-glucosidase